MLGSKEREKERAAAKRKAQALVPAVAEDSEPSSARKKAKGVASPTVPDDSEERDVFGSRHSGSGSVAPEAPKKKTVAVIVSVKEESNEPEVEMMAAERSDEKKTDPTVPPSSGRKKVNPQETHNKAVSARHADLKSHTRLSTDTLLYQRLTSLSISRRRLCKLCSSGGSPRTIPSSRSSGTGSSEGPASHSYVHVSLIWPMPRHTRLTRVSVCALGPTEGPDDDQNHHRHRGPSGCRCPSRAVPAGWCKWRRGNRCIDV